MEGELSLNSYYGQFLRFVPANNRILFDCCDAYDNFCECVTCGMSEDNCFCCRPCGCLAEKMEGCGDWCDDKKDDCCCCCECCDDCQDKCDDLTDNPCCHCCGICAYNAEAAADTGRSCCCWMTCCSMCGCI